MRKLEAQDHRKTARLLAAALLLAGTLLGGAAVHAATNCLNDSDCDGLTNTEETTGITLPSTVTFNGAIGATIPPCPAPAPPSTDPARANCLDPATPEVFVILNRADGSKVPADPWKFVKLATANGGLGINVHELRPATTPATRSAVKIGTAQYAVWIDENLNAAVTTAPQDLRLGTAPHSKPTNLDAFGTVWTRRIEDTVYSKCTSDATPTCRDSSGVSGRANVRDIYIQHTLAHELAHMFMLNTVNNPNFDGWHYRAGSGYVLDQSVSSSTRSGTVTFNITKIYTPTDQSSATLK